ncbi:MAG: hypothetical protein ACP5OB_02995 [Candidatus Ratteibacteria bacterium]
MKNFGTIIITRKYLLGVVNLDELPFILKFYFKNFSIFPGEYLLPMTDKKG